MTERYGWDQTPTPDLGLDITKAPADIQKLYKWVIEKTYGEDVASAYAQGLVLTGILAKDAEAMSLFTSGRMDALTTYVDDMLIEMTDKDIVSAPEIIMARQDANGFSSPTLSERLNRESEGAFVHSDSQFLVLLSNSSIKTIIINRTVNITSDLTIPRGKTLVFKNYGKFVVSAGKTLTVNASIEAGRYLIFDLGIGSKVLSDPTRFGQISRPTNIQQEIYPEWFGAKADAYPSLGYLYADESYALGTDSTLAFKTCMAFAESAGAMSAIEPNRVIHPSVTVSFAPNGTYYGVGDNILGIQSNTPDQGYSVQIKGNGCTIIWKPLNVDDAIFNKYGRIVKPQIHDFNVVLVGAKNQRKGSFIRTSTGQGDEFHIWTGGHLSNLGLGTHSVIGFDTVFMLDVDITDSHDDLTKLSNVMTGAYNTFMEFKNREAVGWLIEKVFFNSQTPGATHVKIGSGFSGGLTFSSCEIILREENETFLKAGSSISPTPIRFINGRMETRGNKKLTLLDVDSGVYMFNNLQMTAGNGETIPHADTRTVKLGKSAFVKFEDSVIYDQMDVQLSNSSPYTDSALEFRNCRMFGSVGNLGIVASYFTHPEINYIYGSNVGNLVDALRSGYSPRRIIVSEPSFGVGGLLLPIETASRKMSHNSESYRLYRHTANGSPCVDIQNINDLPPSIVITSMKLTATSINTNNVDEIRVVFYDRSDPGNNNTMATYTFSGNTDVKNFDILLNNHVYLPVRSYIHITCRKAGAIVTAESLLPVAWFDLEYRAVSMTQDSGELSSNIVRKTSIGK